jgi:hypothetical protein
VSSGAEATTTTTSSATRATATATTAPTGTTKQAPDGGAGAVTSLSVSFGPDSAGASSYTAHVRVHTKSTAAVTVTLTFAGSDSYGAPGSQRLAQRTFTLSGQTSYDVQQSIDDTGSCPSQYMGVEVTGTGGVSAYKDAASSC